MWKGISKFLFLSLTISRIRGHLAWGENQLHPVQGLYVKPSSDGTTGDLYVAATEDHGVDAHWLTDHPVNFLPAAAETKSNKLPVSFTSSFTKTSSPNEESVTTQKRAIITSPQFKYTYALPTTEGSPLSPYPYVAVPVATSEEAKPQCSSEGAPALPGYPQFSPYHYFYPQMMAAIANAMANINDASTENGSNPTSMPYWPGYSYPYQYVMVDPAAWLHSQVSTPTTPATSANE